MEVFKVSLFTGIILFMTSAGVYPQGQVEAWIQVVQERGKIRVSAMCKGPADKKVDYKLTGEKNGPSGHSSISQGGSCKLKNMDTPVVLSKVTLGVGGQDTYVLHLKIFSNGELIAEDMREKKLN